MTIPTLKQIYSSIVADLENELNITIPLFGKSYLRAVAQVQAGRLWLLYLVQGEIQSNIFVDTCDEETLIRFGKVKIGRDPYPARQGQYTAAVIGEIGATIPESTTFKANDDSLNPGQLFVLDTAYTLDGTNVITIRALEGGTGSQLSIGNQLTATAPMALVESLITIQSEVVEPQESEDIEDYRTLIINAFRLEPQGGSNSDYRLWSTEVQGIIQAYPYARNGYASEVNLFLESDETNGIPTIGDIENVRIAIEEPTIDRPARKPTTDIVNYLPVTPLDIDILITDYVDLTTEKETLINTAILDTLNDIRPFVSAIDVLADRNDYLDTNKIISVILAAVPGSIFSSLTLKVSGSPVSSITFVDGNIPKLSSITYDY